MMSTTFEKELFDAVSLREIKERTEVIICTTLMCVYAHPRVPRIKIKEKELRGPFKILYGQEALGRYPWATAAFVSDLLDALLKQIAKEQQDNHLSLRDACKTTVGNSSFWFLNLYGPVEREKKTSNRRALLI